MTEFTETLSDGEPCVIRQLGIFELDDVRAKLIGPYVYEIETVDGRKYLAEYEGSRWAERGERPLKPDTPEHQITPDHEEWEDLVEYLRYEAWLVHEQERARLMNEYHVEVAHYILDNCLSPEDKQRVVTPEDWAVVHKTALVPELTLEVLAETLQATFQGQL
jgi:hypothetical protein